MFEDAEKHMDNFLNLFGKFNKSTILKNLEEENRVLLFQIWTETYFSGDEESRSKPKNNQATSGQIKYLTRDASKETKEAFTDEEEVF